MSPKASSSRGCCGAPAPVDPGRRRRSAGRHLESLLERRCPRPGRLHGLLHHRTEHAGLPAEPGERPADVPAACPIWPTCPSMLVSCPTDC